VVWLTFHEVLTTISCGSSRRAALARRKESARPLGGTTLDVCPIWSRGLPARLAAGVALRCGRIGNQLKSMPDKARVSPNCD
jgi:hypothetical protein